MFKIPLPTSLPLPIINPQQQHTYTPDITNIDKYIETLPNTIMKLNKISEYYYGFNLNNEISALVKTICNDITEMNKLISHEKKTLMSNLYNYLYWLDTEKTKQIKQLLFNVISQMHMITETIETTTQRLLQDRFANQEKITLICSSYYTLISSDISNVSVLLNNIYLVYKYKQ